jgi:hypothetical protein
VASGSIELITTRRTESKGNHSDNLVAVPSFFQRKFLTYVYQLPVSNFPQLSFSHTKKNVTYLILSNYIALVKKVEE